MKRCVWVCMWKWKDCPSSEHQFSTLEGSASGAEAAGGRTIGPTAASPSSTPPACSLQSFNSLCNGCFRFFSHGWGDTLPPALQQPCVLRRELHATDVPLDLKCVN